MAKRRRGVYERRKASRGPRGHTGKAGPKGEPGAWPAEAYDLLQAQMDAIRQEVSQLRERMDQLTETLAQADLVAKSKLMRG
jgi:hypothetical protein